MKFCFVILHYKTAPDTIECIESILNLDGEKYIVVVDNASNNGSIEQVEEKFSNNDKITILKNKENLGFASGNNVGYQYARDVLKADFIAISNNDIVVDTKNFIDVFVDLYKSENFSVAGPDIESVSDKGHQNPMRNSIPEKSKAKSEIWRYRALLLASKLRIYEFLRKIVSKKPKRRNLKDCPENVMKDVLLHGSFAIFSPDFVKNEEYAFRPGTFLYMEEAILRQYCLKKNYKMVFTPFAKVYHKEDSSTDALFNATKEKREFVFKNMIRSLKVYCSVFD